jgi:hypothetical protein
MNHGRSGSDECERTFRCGVWVVAAFLAACSSSGGLAPRADFSALPLVSSISQGTQPFLYHGCPVFAPGDDYNADVTHDPVDPNSNAYVASVRQAGDSAPFSASTGIEKVNLAGDATPLLTVKPRTLFHHFPERYPWALDFFIEPSSDKHAMVVQTQTCHLYEAYDTTYSDGALHAYDGANWDMRDRFLAMHPREPSAMASGLSLFAGMVRWEDYQSGAIRHALNWSAKAHTVAQYAFVAPASDTDGLVFNGKSSYQLPYGARLRLKASFNTAGWGPQGQMVATAMKTYGIYLADTGPYDNALYFANAEDGSNPWSASDLSALSKIHIGDFDVLKMPPIQGRRVH